MMGQSPMKMPLSLVPFCLFVNLLQPPTTMTTTSIVQSNCPEEWALFNGSCFKFFKMNASMLTARKNCWELGQGADLASIHSEDENAFVQGMLKWANIGQNTGFWIGLLLSRTTNMAIQWTDETPVDYGREPLDNKNAVGSPPWYNGSLSTSGFTPEPNNNMGVESCTMLMGQDAGDGAWADYGCWESMAGFVCRKSPSNGTLPPQLEYVRKGGNMSSSLVLLLLQPLFSLFSILLQFYVIWLVINKSPDGMKDYRHFLYANTVSDMAITFIIGFLIVPDNWMPHEYGTAVNGLGRFFGERGGEITLAMAIGAVICQIAFQMCSLLYRFSSVMSREWPKLAAVVIEKASFRIAMFISAFSIAAAVAFIGKNAACNPQVEERSFGGLLPSRSDAADEADGDPFCCVAKIQFGKSADERQTSKHI